MMVLFEVARVGHKIHWKRILKFFSLGTDKSEALLHDILAVSGDFFMFST
jgi:hypothetical protein